MSLQYILAYDGLLFRRSLRQGLDQQPGFHCVGEASNGVELRALLATVRADLILTDYSAPGLRSPDAIASLTEDNPTAYLVICCARPVDDFSHMQLLKAGIRGWLGPETADYKEIAGALRECKETGYFFNQWITSAQLAETLRSPRLEKPALVLKDRERQVLQMLCEDLSNAQIAESLSVGLRTVEGIRWQLLQKTNTRTIAGLVMWAVRNNVVSIEAPSVPAL